MARAFAANRALAPLSFPWTVLAVLPGALRGGLFLDRRRTGMVLLYRSSTLLDTLVLAPIIVVGIGAFFAVTAALARASGGGGLATAINVGATLLVLTGLSPLLPRFGASMLPFGPETPAGQRWEMAGLAQLPGTRLTALATARQALRTVPPPGAVIVATAGTPKLLRHYERFGFTVGRKRRVYLVV